MQAHMSQCGRFFLGIAAAIFSIGTVCAWTKSIGFLLLLLGGPVVIITMVVGGGVFTVHGVRLAVGTDETLPKRVMTTLVAPALLVFCLIVAWPLFSSGVLVGTAARLFGNQSSYNAIIAAERRRTGSEPSGYQSAGGIRYLVDRGPPLRVAFNPEGMLDNWSGIVFDPTHQVTLADGFDSRGRFRAPPYITELFSGDLVACRHLWGDYFHCSFT